MPKEIVSRETGICHDKETLGRICLSEGLELSPVQLDMLEGYVELLEAANNRVNLISRAETEIWEAHILHSLTLMLRLDLTRNSRILDLGTGGGLPGIPLAIARPDLEIVLVDSIEKKVAEMIGIVGALGLRARPVLSRAEALPKLGYSHHFDFVVSRAVAALDKLATWSKPVLVEGESQVLMKGDRLALRGPLLIALKGGDIGDELSTVKRQGPVVVDITLPGLRYVDKKIVILDPTKRA